MSDIGLQRRQLIKGAAAGATALATGALAAAPAPAPAPDAIDAVFAGGDIDWDAVRGLYPAQKPFTNLDNGCIGPPIRAVQEKLVDAYRFANENPCYNMFEVLEVTYPDIKARLAAIADCHPDELALNRCTTVGMCTAILGMPLKAGDEVLLSHWDYPSMINAWKQRAARDGVVLRFVEFGLMDDDDTILAAYTRAVTPRTRAMHMTHLIHWSGRVLPMEEICAFARPRGIRTVIDAAQSFAHIPMSIREIGCDYLATSFHKWLSGPIGTGMLYVRAERIEETWPLFPIWEELPGADKFGMSNLGTFNSAAPYALADAIDFHNRIGLDRKQARLQYLSRYWVERARSIRGFRIHTPMEHPKLGGLTAFSIEGVPVEVIEKRLRDEFAIQTRKRTPDGFRGIRVSPQLYNSTAELDALVDAIGAVASSARG
jgi:selenocysteine lyase/cysteine desulfurase